MTRTDTSSGKPDTYSRRRGREAAFAVIALLGALLYIALVLAAAANPRFITDSDPLVLLVSAGAIALTTAWAHSRPTPLPGALAAFLMTSAFIALYSLDITLLASLAPLAPLRPVIRIALAVLYAAAAFGAFSSLIRAAPAAHTLDAVGGVLHIVKQEREK